jgi:hypothetical protein
LGGAATDAEPEASGFAATPLGVLRALTLGPDGALERLVA